MIIIWQDHRFNALGKIIHVGSSDMDHHIGIWSAIVLRMQMMRWRLDAFFHGSLIILCFISLTTLREILVVDVHQVLINRFI